MRGKHILYLMISVCMYMPVNAGIREMFVLRRYRQKVEALEEKTRRASLEVSSTKKLSDLYIESDALCRELSTKYRGLYDRAKGCADTFLRITRQQEVLRRQAKECEEYDAIK